MDVAYFLDGCTDWELNDILDNLAYLDRNLWESQRLNAYVTALVNSKKRISLLDVCTFKWEDAPEPERLPEEISDEDITRLQKLSLQWEKLD